MTIEIKCPSCGSVVVADDAVSEVFCTYCGTKFPVRQVPADEQLLQDLTYVRNAYAVGEFAEAARCALEQADDPLLAVYAAVAGIRHAYADYVEQATALYNKRSGGSGLMRILTGKDAYGENELHPLFYEDVQKKCAALAAAMRAAQLDSERAALCADVVGEMLRNKSAEKDVVTYWSECALEYQAVPLLPFVETGALLRIYEGYIDFHKPHELLPNQANTEKAMKKELESRGVKAAARPGLGAKVKKLLGGKDGGQKTE